MKRIILFSLTIICLVVTFVAFAETGEIKWFSGTDEVYNSLGEHFRYEAEDDHAVLIQYWIENPDLQPSEVMVPAELNGYPLTVIGWGAFDTLDLRDTGHRYNDQKVERIVLPEGVVTLENGAFLWASVDRIELPTSLTEISPEGLTFFNISAEITFPNGNPMFQSENGFLINTRNNSLLYCDKEASEKQLPMVSRIENNALFNYIPGKNILEFPDSVIYIGSFNAYNGPLAANSLQTIIVPSSVTEIGDFAFYGSTAKTIVLSDGLQRVGSYAFSSTGIHEIGFPATVNWIGYNATDPSVQLTSTPGATCRQETKAEYCARFGILAHANAEVIELSASPMRVLEIIEEDDIRYLRVTRLDDQRMVFTTDALPPFTSLDTYHDGGITILMDIPVDLPEEADWDEARKSPETFDWDLIEDSEAYRLTFDFIDSEWRLVGATNSQDWYFSVRDGVYVFDDYYEYDCGWQWEITGEDRLTEIVFSRLEEMVVAYDEAMPERFSIQPWDEDEEEDESSYD